MKKRPSGFALMLTVLFALIACEKAAPKQDIQPGLTLQIPRPQLKVGDQIVDTEDMAMTMNFDVEGTKLKATFSKRSDQLQKVLAVDGFAASRLQVTYKRAEETQEMMGKSEAKSDPRVGKTYIVSRTNGALAATYEDGTVPPSEELAEVLDDHDEVGVPDEMDAIIAARTWKSGELYRFTADEIARINASKAPESDGSKETLTLVELTLRSAKDGVALFTIAMGMKLEGDDESSFGFTIRGDATVDQASGHLMGISGKGAMKGTVKNMPFDGDVTLKGESRWTK